MGREDQLVEVGPGRASDLGGRFGELLSVGEALVDAGKADVGHPVVLAQEGEDGPPNGLRADLRTALEADLFFDLGRQRVDVDVVQRPVLSCRSQTSKKFAPVERLAGTVPLDDHERDIFDPLERCVPTAARQAFTAAANDRSVLRSTRVDDLVVVSGTPRTSHRSRD